MASTPYILVTFVLCVASAVTQGAAIFQADHDIVKTVQKRSFLGDIPPWMKLSLNMRADVPDAPEADAVPVISVSNDEAPAQPQPPAALTPYIRPRNQCFFHTVSCFGRRPSRLFPTATPSSLRLLVNSGRR
ncbi:uncharacterized protein LOC129596459 [Paramacrobiotus metropolitanus]|uniref:uncharacterized protein LOC129596459 n=1 Tax=Paramacrobiotus metropolitanus TaxID=2943436 RepID=UPI002445FEB5|nr:uncharacterized protein LOC129596459 [Paramacrobiotus metropolitanus]XP_055349709.1 uncharacterized protein LOC129596459 [Paramacrobiotus metropolitanus]XP_055349710.1 uncharacterized protein LOC129596459 [Paramacrobiotus metropolitanus]XP_055349711.1 uncharacterized protein LOC129596459 [Paramacrobiotus metropolitanus]XP_055349712.1 uncharacterized protein LOC129596459 [Paramacrobiotus metropolitanus]XP_055349713.1 uncharacterized protein LOC129596459 [Paramacrobiotus metropolitanus]